MQWRIKQDGTDWVIVRDDDTVVALPEGDRFDSRSDAVDAAVAHGKGRLVEGDLPATADTPAAPEAPAE